MQRDESAGNAGSARAAVRLYYVAIYLYGSLAEFFQVHHTAQAAPDQALNFLGTSGLFALGRFARHAAAGRSRQHAVFRRDPTFAGAFFVGWNFLFDTGRADDFGVTAFDQH